MRAYRGLWSVGLALSLAGCAGTREGLVETGPTGGPIRSRILAWRSGPAASASAPTAVAAPNPDAGKSSTETLQAATVAAASPPPRTADPKVTVEPPTRTGRLSKYIPGLNRAETEKALAKAKSDNEFIRPAGRDLWAESARRGAQERLDRWRDEARVAATGANNDGSTVLPVSMEVGTSQTTVRPRTVEPASRSQPRPRLATPPIEEAKTDGGPTGVIPAAAPSSPDANTPPVPAPPSEESVPTLPELIENETPTPTPLTAAAPTEPATIPAASETPATPTEPAIMPAAAATEPVAPPTDPATTLTATGSTASAIAAPLAPVAEPQPELSVDSDTPPAPDRPAAPAAPPARSAPPNPNAKPDLDTAPPAPRTAPPAPNATTAPEPDTAPAKPEAPATAPANPEAAKPADDAMPVASPATPAVTPLPAIENAPPEQAAPVAPAAAPVILGEPQTPQVTYAAPSKTAPSKVMPQPVAPSKVAPTAKHGSWIKSKKARLHRAWDALTGPEPAPAPTVGGATPSQQTPIYFPTTTAATTPPPPLAPSAPEAAAVETEAAQPTATAVPASNPSVSRPKDTILGSHTQYFPSAYYAQTVQTTGIAPATALADNADTQSGETSWRPRLLPKLVARFKGSEEVASHPIGCRCGRHPVGPAAPAAPSTVIAASGSSGRIKVELPPTPDVNEELPIVSVGAMPDDVTQYRDVLQRVSTNGLNEAPQR